MNTKLTYLSVSLNGIKVTEMENLINSLPTLTKSSGNVANLYLDGNEVTQVQYADAVAKGWAPYVDKFYDAGGLAINEKNFPDENFRNYVADNLDLGHDGYLSDEERNNVKWLDDLDDKEIANLKGIEWFPNLERMSCVYNQIETFNVSNNTKIKSIYCFQNKISGANMDNMISNLPVMPGGKLYVLDFDDYGEGNRITPDQVAAAKKKGWTVYARKDIESVEFGGAIPGDVNEDGNVNVGDIMAVINVMANGTPNPLADVNNDGNVNVGDIMAIINIMAAGK